MWNDLGKGKETEGKGRLYRQNFSRQASLDASKDESDKDTSQDKQRHSGRGFERDPKCIWVASVRCQKEIVYAVRRIFGLVSARYEVRLLLAAVSLKPRLLNV